MTSIARDPNAPSPAIPDKNATGLVKAAPLPLGGLTQQTSNLPGSRSEGFASGQLDKPLGGSGAASTLPAAPLPPTPDPMAFQPPPGAPPTAPNPAFSPPGGFGTNTAAAQPNGDPAAPPGTFDAFHALQASSKAALAGGAQPNAGGGFRDFTQTATGTAPTVSNAAGAASLHQNQIDDATAQLPGGNARFTDTMQGGTSFGAANPTTSTQDWINNQVAKAESPNGGANPNAAIGDVLKGLPVANTSGGSGAVGPDGKLAIPGSANTPWTGGGSPPPPTGPAAGAAGPSAPGAGLSLAGVGGQSATAGPNAGVGLSQTDPNNALIDKTIAPNGSVDRVKNFQDSLQSTISNVLDPAFQARQRDSNRYQFGAGRGVSGTARTSQGDIVSDYGRQIKDLTTQGLANASTGSIDDMYKNVGIAQQQQGFQKNLSDTAFNQNVVGTQLEDQLTNSASGRALQQTLQGFGMSPEQTSLILSQITGQQAGQAGQAASGLFGQAGQKAGTPGSDTTAQVLAYLKSLGLGGGGTGSGTGNQEVGPQ